VLSEMSWIATVAFVALTGIAGLADAASTAPVLSTRRLLLVAGAVVLPAALFAGLLFSS